VAYTNGADASKGERGADYIYDAFVFARLADPNATLYYNDYNEDLNNKPECISLMVEDLNAKWKLDPNYDGRLLVEGIGMQSHYWSDAFEADNEINLIEAAMQRFIKTGAVISITELDIPMGTYQKQHNGKNLTAEQETQQAKQYAELFNLYKKYAEHIQRVTFWGLADSLSWRGQGMPLLFDKSYYAKEAFWAVIDPDEYAQSETKGVRRVPHGIRIGLLFAYLVLYQHGQKAWH
jgi:endo-1,4-beta-xylanase